MSGTSNKFDFQKLNKYRQKIKQNIIAEQQGLNKSTLRTSEYAPYNPHFGRQQPTSRTDNYSRGQNYIKVDNYSKKPQSTLSRSNLFKNPSQIMKMSRQNQQSRQKKVNISSSANNISSSQNRTASKSKSPIKGTDSNTQNDLSTKRKISSKQAQLSNSKINPYLQEKGGKGHNLSAFDTFSPKPSMIPAFTSSILPSTILPSSILTSPITSSTNVLAQQQVKVLLQQNHALSTYLNDRMQRIKSLQNQLNCALKSQIMYQQKFDLQKSQVLAQNSMIKKSTDQQINTLVQQIKKLNAEIEQNQINWQNKLNAIRKTNLQQIQQLKIISGQAKQTYEEEISNLQRKLQASKEQYSKYIEQNKIICLNYKNQITELNKVIDKLNHNHKVQKLEISMSHQNKIVQIKAQQMKKLQISHLDRIHKQNQLQHTIIRLNKQIQNLNQQIQRMKHQKDFRQIKEMQQKGKLTLEMRQQKIKNNKVHQQQKQKQSKLSKTQLQLTVSQYETQIQILLTNISALQGQILTQQQEMSNLYKQISQIRSNYQQQLSQKQNYISCLKENINKLVRQNSQEQECLKIKIAELNQANMLTVKNIYQHQIEELKTIILDKDIIIKSLRQKVQSQIQSIELLKRQHFNEVRQLKIVIEQKQQSIAQNRLKDRANEQNVNAEKIVLKQNLLRQAESSNKTSVVKDQNIRRLQKIIENKDKQIQQLINRIQIVKKSHKQQLSLLNSQNQLLKTQNEQTLRNLREQLDYNRKQLNKKSQQFSTDKQYYSNQLRQAKQKGQRDFNESIDKIASEINQIKDENNELKLSLEKTTQLYKQYRSLWNQQAILVKLKAQQQQYSKRLFEQFVKKQQKLILSHQQDVDKNYKPRIQSLQQLITQKQKQVQDLKYNYHDLQKKFQLLIQSKMQQNQLNKKIIEIAKNNSNISGNYLSLNR